jgi:hypothetical protein
VIDLYELNDLMSRGLCVGVRATITHLGHENMFYLYEMGQV